MNTLDVQDHSQCRDRPTHAKTVRRTPKLIIITITLSLIALGCGTDPTDGATEMGIQAATPSEFLAYIDANPDTPLINVHIPYQGHIEGTDEFVPFDQVLEWPGLPADITEPIALYCRSGNMSGQAAQDLIDAGYTNIIDLTGGMNAWTETGGTLQDSPPPTTG